MRIAADSKSETLSVSKLDKGLYFLAMISDNSRFNTSFTIK
jgi:hypothetical protein